MSRFVILGTILLAAACASAPASSPASAPAAQPAPAPQPQVTEVQPVAAPPRGVTKDQPPHMKLKLGHYRNRSLGIGVVIDLTEATDNVADIDPAKIRFDGDNKVYKLTGRQGPYGRIDYTDGQSVMLKVWEDGRREVFIPDPTTGRVSDEISVYRDGDADPL